MKEQKYVIWQNIDTDYDGMREDYQECNDLSDEEMEEVSDYTISMWAYETNDYYLDDERVNLDIQLDDEIIVIGELGLWNGRVSGYKIIKSGNIKDCLCCDDDYVEWYCDRYDMRGTGIHHDGRNYYLYRTWKNGITEQQKENFLERIYYKKSAHKDILRYTRSIRPYISAVYGWGGKQKKVVRKQKVVLNNSREVLSA